MGRRRIYKDNATRQKVYRIRKRELTKFLTGEAISIFHIMRDKSDIEYKKAIAKRWEEIKNNIVTR